MSLKLSIVSPSFNQIEFIGRTLDSVASQTYEHIEHIIQDAGSTADCRAIIDAYVSHNPRARCYYEADDGQSDAILRGFRKSSGDIITWLNTDDFYADAGAVSDVMRLFEAEPEIDIVYGRGSFVDADGKALREVFVHRDSANLLDHFVRSVGILQPALFFRRHLLDRTSPIETSMACAFDYELWVRMLADGAHFRFLDRLLVNATFHSGAKSSALRSRQLLESADVVAKHYGFASADWLTRFVECELHGTNGIIDIVPNSGDKTLSESFSQLLFRRLNSNNLALYSLRLGMEKAAYKKSVAMAESLGLTDFDKIVVTTFDDNYLSQGLTLIDSIRKQEGAHLPVFVYDLNLSSESLDSLLSLYNVYIVPYPSEAVSAYDDFLKPKNYGYKCTAINDSQRFVRNGGIVLWIDAGVAAINPLLPIFDLIEKDEVFFVDHDDKPTWPFYNGTFCHPTAALLMKASVEELFGEHLCSCLVGYKKGGKFSQLFLEAHRYALNRQIVVWDKHPSAQLSSDQDAPSRAPNTAVARRTASDPALVGATTFDEAAAVLGYQGHRQDQTIFSILAARFDAPIQSATIYCRSDEASSIASKLNWLSGSVSKEVQPSPILPENIKSAITYHHRGLFLSNDSRLKSIPSSDTLVLVGNGPSLKGFDLTRLSVFDTIGMNAAYRHWDAIGWYPTYYICLDKVVGLSHKDEIARLIRERSRNGIRAFFLRNNLIKELPSDVANSDVVFDFDAFRTSSPLFSPMPITTGSHASLFGALLGYRRMILAGIDCNYVEKVEGAVERGGTLLEIVGEQKANPNYFFEGYQVVGDKYNIPNSSPDLHIDSWRAVAPVLAARGITVWNMSEISRVDVFPRRSLQEIIATGGTSRRIDGQMKSKEYDREAHVRIDETEVISYMLRDRIGDAHVMLDVGAHFGTSATYFDALEWTIYCFEPDPANRDKLAKRFGGKHSVVIDPRAVGDQPAASVPFFRSDESTGISGLHAFRETHREDGKVDVTTIADVVEARGITHVDFLKIDVEGFDFAVLKGVPWNHCMPDVIECEFEDRKTVPLGHTYRDVAQFLADMGYAIYLSEWHPIIRYGIPHDWYRLVRFPQAELASDAWGNILAFKSDPGLEVLSNAFEEIIRRKNRGVAGAPVNPGSARDRSVQSLPVASSLLEEASALKSSAAPSLPKNGNTLESSAALPLVKDGKALKSPAASSLPENGNKLSPRAVSSLSQAGNLGQEGVINHRGRPSIVPHLSNYERFVIWARREHPVINRLGQFAMWSLRTARRHVAAATALAAAFIGLTVGGALVPSAAGAVVLWAFAAVLGAACLSVAVMGFARHLLKREIQGMRAKFVSLERQLRNLDRGHSTEAKLIAQLTTQTSKLGGELSVQTNKLRGELADQISKLRGELAEQTNKLREDLTHQSRQFHASTIEALDQRAFELKKGGLAEKPTTRSNSNFFQLFNRSLSQEHLDAFVADWTKPLGLELKQARVGYLAHRACVLESQMKGRLATSIEAIVLRSLVASAVKRTDISILEIGTLFGIGAAAVYEAATNASETVHITVIDPLDGYYGPGKPDLLTGARVDEATLRHNWSRAGIPEKDYTIIKHFSTDPVHAIEAARRRAYDVLIIDGDHSFDGVKFDFENYAPLVRPGGYILFDDYDVPEWPDIKRYVDNEIAGRANLRLVGAAFRTAVFQVTDGSRTEADGNAS